MSLYHHFMQVQAYKHDGSFHRLWSHGLVVRDDEDYVVIVSNRVRVIESDDHFWHTKEKAVFIFSKKEWFNVIVTFLETGVRYYVNIASPTIIDKGFIKFIDYDLDLKAFPDGFTKVLDVNEFNDHCNKYGYSEELKKILKKSLDHAIKKFKNKEEPYQEDLIKKYMADYDEFVANQERNNKQKEHYSRGTLNEHKNQQQ